MRTQGERQEADRERKLVCVREKERERKGGETEEKGQCKFRQEVMSRMREEV